ncbi:Major facilitator superfamily MFS_1 [Cupriavidus taiwanensis]|uniref:MFS transporter n=1 Tax=Cupriavidus taiwanensis TaxID=164546 RepID=UPI000E179426|nr:MFS transporter [Cupriavidus taiwanensis]SOY79538.1 Major facilitator superfamily MFS_1 [Cupriavidus taiwanensis]SOY81512.1 Major facilitator superfamily MFS_1 [Cupriavidus taiwanensis]
MPSLPSPALSSPSASEAVRPTSVRWRIFLIMLLLTAINYIDRASLSVALPLIAPEFNLSPALEGLMLSAFFWSYALMQIPAGVLLDRYHTRGIIAAATVAWGAFQALGAASHNWIVLLLTRMGLGVSESPIMPAGAKLIGSWLTPHERGRGAVLVDGGAPLGSALGAILISGLIAWFGSWRIAFVIAGVGTMLAGVLAWRYIRNHPSDHPGVNAAELEHITRGNARASAAAARVPLRELVRDRSVLAMFAGYSCILAVFYGLLTWMPSYLHKAHGFNIAAMGGATFIIFMSGFVGELIGGYIGDRWKASGASPNVVMRTMFSGSSLVAAACILAAAYIPDSGTVVVLLCVAMFFIRFCGMYWSLPAIVGGPERSGVLGGTMNFCGNMAGVVVPILIGVIVQWSGSYFLALLFFVVMAVLIAVFSSLIDYRPRAHG